MITVGGLETIVCQSRSNLQQHHNGYSNLPKY